MRIAYLDCASGISGDMTLGALVDAGVDLAAVQAGIDSLGLPSCRLATAEVKKKGFRALQLTVEHEPEHKHRHLHHITAMIDGSIAHAAAAGAGHAHLPPAGRGRGQGPRHDDREGPLPRGRRRRFDRRHRRLGDRLGPAGRRADRLLARADRERVRRDRPRPLCDSRAGDGRAACAACRWPTSPCEGELTTPTGAAIVATLVDEFGPLPAMTIERIGYGAGQKDFDARQSAAADRRGRRRLGGGDATRSCCLETNLDDATGESIGYCAEQLWKAGALDVSTTPLAMKKNRPGVLLAVQCRPADAEKLAGDRVSRDDGAGPAAVDGRSG